MTRMKGVIPCRQTVAATLEHRLHLQPGRRLGAFDIARNGLERAQRHSRPIQTDVTKQPMLDRVPFRTARQVMAHCHVQTGSIAQLLLPLRCAGEAPRASVRRALALGEYPIFRSTLTTVVRLAGCPAAVSLALSARNELRLALGRRPIGSPARFRQQRLYSSLQFRVSCCSRRATAAWCTHALVGTLTSSPP
jgi:hypothetical protein